MFAFVVAPLPRPGGHVESAKAGCGEGTVQDPRAKCIAPGSLDNGLDYAARLKVSSCQAARMSAGLRWPFFSISHSAL